MVVHKLLFHYHRAFITTRRIPMVKKLMLVATLVLIPVLVKIVRKKEKEPQVAF